MEHATAAAARPTERPTGAAAMPQRTVATDICGEEQDWRSTTRRCKYSACQQPFLPVRQSQEFCPGGSCRNAWWREQGFLTRPHHCRCGRECVPVPGPYCQRPFEALAGRHDPDASLPGNGRHKRPLPGR